MNVNEVINNFNHFLNTAWVGLPEWITKNENREYEINNWLQANWEILVESKLNEPFRQMKPGSERIILNYFGDGADIDERGSSRVIYPDDIPTHTILVNDKFRFDSIGTKYETGWFEPAFPFNHVKAIDEAENEVIIPATEALFSLRKIENVK